MSPKQTFQTASDSSIAKGAVGVIVIICLSLSGWALGATASNTRLIQAESIARVKADGDIRERLARIETNTDLILKAVADGP